MGRFKDADVETKAKAHRVLLQLLNDLTLAGNKSVQVFELTKEQVADLSAKVESIKPRPSAYATAFPWAISETELRTAGSEQELTAKIVHDNGDVSLVFCAKRTQDERDRYAMSEVTKAVKDSFVGYDEFIAIKRTHYQIFDVVSFRPKLKRLEVLVDHPHRLRSEETSELRCLGLLNKVSSVAKSLRPLYEKNQPINLLACINNLYLSTTEGRVSKLFYRSPTDSVKRDSMVANKDQRTEVFHAAGVKAVGKITPFDITVVWDSLPRIPGSVEIRVGMSIAGLSAEATYVRDAEVTARSDAAMVAAINKLVSYSD